MVSEKFKDRFYQALDMLQEVEDLFSSLEDIAIDDNEFKISDECKNVYEAIHKTANEASYIL